MTAERLKCDWLQIDGAVRATSPTDTLEWNIIAAAPYDLPITEIRLEVRAVGSETVLAVASPKASSMAPLSPIGWTTWPGRMPGAPAGAASPAAVYQVTFPAASLPVGVLRGRAIITAGGFTYQVPEEMRVFNHHDGTAMPSSKVRYVDRNLGSDSNNGLGWGTAFQTLMRAIMDCRANPGGTTLADQDCAGATIYVRGTVTGGGSTNSGYHTSSPGWLTIVADSGAIMTTANPPDYVPPGDAISCTNAFPGSEVRLRVRGFEGVGRFPVVFTSAGVTTHVWTEGCTLHSANWNPAKPYSVRWRDDYGGWFSADGGNVPGLRRYATGCSAFGVTGGYGSFDFVYDCKLSSWLGIALYMIDRPKAVYHTIHCDVQDYTPASLLGYVLRADGVQLTASTPAADVLRIQGPVGVDFSASAQELVGGTFYGLIAEGWATSAINGVRIPIAAGYSGSRTYVDFNAPGLVLAAPENGQPASRLVTAQAKAGLNYGVYYYDGIHPDGISMSGDRTRDVVRDIAFSRVNGLQFVFSHTSGSDTKDQAWIENIRDEGSTNHVWNFFGTNFTNSLVRNVVCTGPLQLSAGRSHLGTTYENCIFGTAPDAGVITAGAWFVGCHFVSGATLGYNPSSGAVWVSSPLVAPYQMVPLNQGTGEIVATEPPYWRWTTAPTRGAYRNTMLLDWSAGSGSVVTPTPNRASSRTPAATVVLGSVSVSPARNRASSRTPVPAVGMGTVLVTPAAQRSAARTPACTVTLGALSIASASNRASSRTPAVVVDFGSLLLKPSNNRSSSRVVDPAVVLSTVTEPNPQVEEPQVRITAWPTSYRRPRFRARHARYFGERASPHD